MPTAAAFADDRIARPVSVTIRAKLILAFSMVASVPLVGGAIGYYAYQTADHQTQVMRELTLQAIPLFGAAKALEAYGNGGAMYETANGLERREAVSRNLALIRSQSKALGISDDLFRALTKSHLALSQLGERSDLKMRSEAADSLAALSAQIESRMTQSPQGDISAMLTSSSTRLGFSRA
jgi:hypothetical protein